MGSYVSIPAYSRSLLQRYCLVGLRCNGCRAINFPGTESCRRCGRENDFESSPLPRLGKLISLTVIEPGGAPSEFAGQVRLHGPYAVGLVKLSEGTRILAQMTDGNPYDLKIGDEVEAVIRVLYQQEGIVRYSFKFRPRRVQTG